MKDFAKELEDILKNDPLNLLNTRPRTDRVVSADQRLLNSFEEINAFYQEHGRVPEKSRNIKERKLYSRLQGILESPEKALALADADEFGLLKSARDIKTRDIKTIDDVLSGDALGLLDDTSEDIFTLRHVAPPTSEQAARRTSCDEFEQFEPLFKQIQRELKRGTKTTIPFVGERQIEPGTVFILQGMLVYVANQGAWEKKNFGRADARLYCVFENGTESNMYLRSLAATLWKTKDSRKVIASDQLNLPVTKVGQEDESTGFIYVVRSLTRQPELNAEKDLYKIGFSTQTVQQRTQNAANDPTYLMADVVPVVEYEAFNVSPQKVETLLHTFFSEACLDIEIYDAKGKKHKPREWFVVPLHIIEGAIEMLISGEIINYQYNHRDREIVAR